MACVSGISKSYMLIKHKENDVLYLNMLFLLVFYRHVRFWRCPKHVPQQHFEVQSLVGVGFQNVPVARVLGMSESAKMFSPYAFSAKSLPGGLRESSEGWSRDSGEGRERLPSFSFQLQYTVSS